MTRGWRTPVGRVLLAAAGLTLVAYLVRGAGPARVAHVLLQSWSWLPGIVALEMVQLLGDVAALRSVLVGRGEAQDTGSARDRVPPSAWLRSSAVAYAMMILLPAGRAAGEVARATLIAKHVGTAAAAAASAQLQAAYLLALAAASGAAAAVVGITFGVRTPLAWLLAANVAVMTIMAALLVAVLYDARIGRWLDVAERRLGLPRGAPAVLAWRAPRGVAWSAVAACSVARAAQLAQYGLLLGAVGGRVTARTAFIAHGIHLVGATLGDAVPNQLGIVDGTYRAFAPTLGFGDAPARALSIAFLAHATQLGLAGVCVVLASFLRPGRERGEGSTERSGERDAVDPSSLSKEGEHRFV